MKKIVSLLLTLCLALGMVSMAAADEEGFVLDLCIASEPETIDPNWAAPWTPPSTRTISLKT